MILSIINVIFFVALIFISVKALILDSSQKISIPKTDRSGLLLLAILSIISIINNILAIFNIDILHKTIDHETVRAAYELLFAAGMIYLIHLKMKDYQNAISSDNHNDTQLNKADTSNKNVK